MVSKVRFENIRGIEFGNLVVEFGDGKLVFLSKKDPAVHFTVTLQTESGILDVHKTTVGHEGRKRYETVFAMKREDVPAMFSEMSELIVPARVSERLRPLRFGWLRRQFMYLLAGQYLNDDQFRAVSKRNERRRLELDVNNYRSNLQPLVDYESCIEFDSPVFGVFAVTKKLQAKQIGVAFKILNPKTERIEIQWLKLNHLNRFVQSAVKDFESIARKYEIPKDEQRQYDFS